MRIGIENHYVHGMHRGTRTYLEQITDIMPALSLEHDFYLYSPGYNHNKQVRQNIWEIRSPFNNNQLNYLIGFRQVANRDNLSLFHSQYVVALGLKIPQIITVHDVFPATHPQYFPLLHRKKLDIMMRLVVSKAAIIITVSKSSKDAICEHYNVSGNRVKVIYEAASDFFSPRSPDSELQEKMKSSGITPPFFLFVGRLVPIKNVRGLILSYGLFRERSGTSVQLVIVGEKDELYGDDLSREAYESCPYKHSIVFAGSVNRTLLRLLYSEAEALVLTSFSEGFGLPVLEAMACGTPCIVSNRGSLPEIVGDAGKIVDITTPDALADAMLDHIERQDLMPDKRKAAIERAATFSWKRCAQETLEIYRQILS